MRVGVHELLDVPAVLLGDDRLGQMRVLAAGNSTGVPLHVRPHPGRAAELTCLGQAMDHLARPLPPWSTRGGRFRTGALEEPARSRPGPGCGATRAEG